MTLPRAPEVRPAPPAGPASVAEDSADTTVISDTPASWFWRGWMLGVMTLATLNAVSYFFRSRDWTHLVGGLDSRDTGRASEAIGFPWRMWESGNNYGGYFVDYRVMLANAAVAMLTGLLVGAIVRSQHRRLNRLANEITKRMPKQVSTQNLQFSLRGLLFWTIAAGLVCGILRNLFAEASVNAWMQGRREALGAIYLLGPWLLVSLALLPRRIPWQHRVGLIIPLTLGLIVFAVGVGAAVGRDMEQVIMGIYVCWTPQAMFAATVLTIALIVSHHYQSTAANLGPPPSSDAPSN